MFSKATYQWKKYLCFTIRYTSVHIYFSSIRLRACWNVNSEAGEAEGGLDGAEQVDSLVYINIRLS